MGEVAGAHKNPPAPVLLLAHYTLCGLSLQDVTQYLRVAPCSHYVISWSHDILSTCDFPP